MVPALQVSAHAFQVGGRLMVTGHSYREDPKVQKAGTRKAFHLGSNSSCRQHIRQHYEIYKARCEGQNIPIQSQAIPRPIWKALQAEKESKGKKQTILDDSFAKMPAAQRKEFTREGIVDAVTRLIVLDDQVSTRGVGFTFPHHIVLDRSTGYRTCKQARFQELLGRHATEDEKL